MIKFNLSKEKLQKFAQINSIMEAVYDFLSSDEANQEISSFNNDLYSLIPESMRVTVAGQIRQVLSDFNTKFVAEAVQRQDDVRVLSQRYQTAKQFMNQMLESVRLLVSGNQVPSGPSEAPPQPETPQPVAEQTHSMFSSYVKDNTYGDDHGNLAIESSDFSLPPEGFDRDEFIKYLNETDYSEAFISLFVQSMDSTVKTKGAARNLTKEQIDHVCQTVMVSLPTDDLFRRQLAEYITNKGATVVGKRLPRKEEFDADEMISDKSRQTETMNDLLSQDPKFLRWYNTNKDFVDEGTTRALSQRYLPAKNRAPEPTFILVDKLDGRIAFILSDSRILQRYAFPCGNLMTTFNSYSKKKKSALYDDVKQQIMNCPNNGLEEFIDSLIQNKDPQILQWVQRSVGALAAGEGFDMLKLTELEPDKGDGKYELQGKSLDSATGKALSEKDERAYRKMGSDFIDYEFEKVTTVTGLVIPEIYRMGVFSGDPGKIANANAMKFVTDLFHKRLKLLLNQGRFIVDTSQGGGKIAMQFFYPTSSKLKSVAEAEKRGFMKIIFDPKSPDRGIVDLEFRKLVTRWGSMSMSLGATPDGDDEAGTVKEFRGIVDEQLASIDRIVQKYDMYKRSHGDQSVDTIVSYILRDVNAGLNPKDQYTPEGIKYLLSKGKSDILLHQNIPDVGEYLQYKKETLDLKRRTALLIMNHPEKTNESIHDSLIDYKISKGFKLGGLSLEDINAVKKYVRTLVARAKRLVGTTEMTPAIQSVVMNSPDFLSNEDLYVSDYYKHYGKVDETTGEGNKERVVRQKSLSGRMKGENLRWDAFNWVKIMLEGLKDGSISFESLKPFFYIFVPHYTTILPSPTSAKSKPGGLASKRTPIMLRMRRKPLYSYKPEQQKRIKELLTLWGATDVLNQMEAGAFKPIGSDEAAQLLEQITKKSASEEMIKAAFLRTRKKLAALYVMKKAMVKLSSKTSQIDNLMYNTKVKYEEEVEKYLYWGENYDQDFDNLPMWQYRI